MSFSILLDLGASIASASSESAHSLSEQFDFLQNWTIPFALTAAGDRDVEILVKLPFDAPAAAHREVERLGKLPQVKIVTNTPFQALSRHASDGLIFSIQPSQLLLPDLFTALEDWNSESLVDAPYRFTKRYSSTLLDSSLRGMKLEAFDLPLATPYITSGSQASADLTRQRFTVDMDTIPLIEVKNAPFHLHQKEVEPSSTRIMSPEAMREILPSTFSSKLFKPKKYSINLGNVDPFDEPVIINVNARGPFTLLLKGVINGGVFPKHSLVSFTFENAYGENVENVEIPGLAYSLNPSIGYFFYYLGAEPGPFTFEYKVPAPDDYTCTQIKIMKWDGNRRAMTCNSLEITEL